MAFGIEERRLSFGPTIKGATGVPADIDERGFRVDSENQTIDVFWGQYEYIIEFNRIDTPEKALAWLHHIGEKTWTFTTGERMLALLSECAGLFGWDLYKTV